MAVKAENVGVAKATKDNFSAFFLAITAGAFIAIAFIFYVTVTTGAPEMGWGPKKMLGGVAFSLGLVLVVVCGGELFTSTVLTTVARASSKITNSQLFKSWIIVWLGNFVGSLFMVGLMLVAKQHMADHGQWGLNAMQVAQHKLHHNFAQAVALGIACNLMVCLGVWMTFSARSLTDKMLIVILPVAMFVASGFEHVVANMFMIPMGIAISQFAGPEFWQAINMAPDQFADLTVGNMMLNNILPVTIGNILGGGVLVGLTYWVIYLRPKSEK